VAAVLGPWRQITHAASCNAGVPPPGPCPRPRFRACSSPLHWMGARPHLRMGTAEPTNSSRGATMTRAQRCHSRVRSRPVTARALLASRIPRQSLRLKPDHDGRGAIKSVIRAAVRVQSSRRADCCSLSPPTISTSWQRRLTWPTQEYRERFGGTAITPLEGMSIVPVLEGPPVDREGLYRERAVQLADCIYSSLRSWLGWVGLFRCLTQASRATRVPARGHS